MSKPSNGSVRKRKNGRYQARFRLDGHVHTSTHDTRGEASNWLTEMRERHHRGRLRPGLDPTTISLGVALTRYAKEISPAKKNSRKEIGAIKRLLRDEPKLCAIPLSRVMIADLNDFALRRTTKPSKRTGRPVCADTVRNDLAIISNLFTIARVRWGYESLITPVCRGSRPKIGKGRERRVSRVEEAAFYREAADYESDHESTVPIGAVIRFAILTAMRRGEIAALDWSRVDLRVGLVTVVDTKNGSTRSVPLRDEAYEMLFNFGPRDSGSVFGTTSASIGTAFARVKARTNLEGIRFHDLRHEATSRFFEDAAKFKLTDMEIAAITGHKSMAMLRRYTHLRANSIAAKLRSQSVNAQIVNFDCVQDHSDREVRRGLNGRFVIRAALPKPG